MLSNALLKLSTYYRLGLISIARVAGYRIGLKAGLNPIKRIREQPALGPFFRSTEISVPGIKPSSEWNASALYFGWKEVPLSGVPAWHSNVFNGRETKADDPWWELSDFDDGAGDIKTIWEASRFDWVLCLAQRAASGDTSSLRRLNAWLDDWSLKNPPYMGVNWKCGQEASIRVMHLTIAALILKQVDSPSQSLLDMVRIHLRRIAPTIRYAVGQDNNHGSSEAAALFIGGSLLVAHGIPEGFKWQRSGRKWLENRVANLIDDDGGFSQYSVNYHRVLLDTLSMVEVWRQRFKLSTFSTRFYSKAASSAQWLYMLVQEENGDAPNIGANDGARLLPLSDTDYRDFRPSVQMAMALFAGKCAYSGVGDWNTPLQWLGIDLPKNYATKPECNEFDHGGYVVIRMNEAMGLIRYPRFRFRPSHADALHFDLWHKGQNVLRDGGTFSYNTDLETLDYFSGTESHNTIQFDGMSQMPRLGRFLFGAWIKMDDYWGIQRVGGSISWTGAYKDYRKNRHRRTVRAEGTSWHVVDEISGSYSTAILRWRLAPGEWKLAGNLCVGEKLKLSVSVNDSPVQLSLSAGWESRYYMQKEPLPVLEIALPAGAAIIKTDLFLD
ncbi:heparinase II/III family protein [Desulfosediminicola ganghwensis]|uniref:heparinase II/III family protein n=1 Tax=Desulfosediminicola ganghwensis TaxID=2569540 RepID=UPI0010AC32CD|nr:heparinase II/III-family protein [Desulfosediminicola ganghwensis]